MKIKMLEKRALGSAARTGCGVLLPYAGKRIKTQIVDTIGGWYKPGYASTDALCRTAAGEYFLAREIYLDPLGEGEPQFHLPGDGSWLRVKRLSLRGAILCGLRDCDKQLRADALRGIACQTEKRVLLRELFSMQKFCNEIVGKYTALRAGKKEADHALTERN